MLTDTVQSSSFVGGSPIHSLSALSICALASKSLTPSKSMRSPILRVYPAVILPVSPISRSTTFTSCSAALAFDKTPSAPQAFASISSCEESCIDRSRIFVAGTTLRIWRAASIPFNMGMLTSRMIRSGSSVIACATASRPLEPSPQIVKFPFNLLLIPVRTNSWSSTRRMRFLTGRTK